MVCVGCFLLHEPAEDLVLPKVVVSALELTIVVYCLRVSGLHTCSLSTFRYRLLFILREKCSVWIE